MVEADALEADSVVEALATGHFYSSTGVFLSKLTQFTDEISLEIRKKGDSIFITRFIGASGIVHDEQVGREVTYRPSGEEGYIRAHVFSSDGLQAWTQPVFLS